MTWMKAGNSRSTLLAASNASAPKNTSGSGEKA